MTSKAFGFPLPSNAFTVSNIQIQGERGADIGIKTTNTMVVTEINFQSISYGKFLIGDVLLSINGQMIQSKTQFTEIYAKASQLTTFCLDLVISRPVVMLPIRPTHMPKGYQLIAGCKYHLGVMYRVPGAKLGLSITSYQSKVFVTRTEDGTLASMTLKIGDAILAIEGQAVTTVAETSEALFKALKAKGYAAMAIEQPQEMMNKNVVRTALNSDPPNEGAPAQKDVVLICGTELKRFQTNPELQPNKILKDKQNQKEAGHVKVSEKAEDIPIACDGNPGLLMPVPIPNFQIQQSVPAQSPPASLSQQK
uniref:PDZ domain-containing protein n=1 Tax=Panagrolaimus superbus TaxID=310955 RepID=A0A914XYG6_9BILA